MFEVYQNILCVQGGQLYEKGIMTKTNYGALSRRAFKFLRNGGNGRTALIDFNSIPSRFQKAIIDKWGDPFQKDHVQWLINLLETDDSAADYYNRYRLPDGRFLPEDKQREYFTNAQILNAIDKAITSQKQRKNAGGKASLTKVWDKIAAAVQELEPMHFPHSLPTNWRALQRKYRKYKAESYASLIHKNFCNDNSVKIEGAIADWILATYCLPNKLSVPVVHMMYQKERVLQAWPSLTESAISFYLDKPEVKRIWTIARHGRDAYINQFSHHLKRSRDNWFPNAYWVIDGTKLDWIHYEDNTLGMAAKLKINPVVDVYSEKIIGWSYSETEDHTDHFRAVKMATQTAQTKPYLFTYDNQSGHKSEKMQQLYSKLVAKGGTHHPHRAYRKSNPIEQLFNRLQQQVINKFWFSDGQSIKVRRLDNSVNLDFINENKHRLMTREKLERAWEVAVMQWNDSPHPKIEGKTRNQVYEMDAPMSDALTFLDQVEMFWINSKPITYQRGGILINVAKKQHEFEVYTEDGFIDLEFRRLYVGSKFIVKYDPDELDNYIRLYAQLPNGDLQFVANAQPKREHQSIPVLMQEGDKEAWHQDYKTRDEEMERDEAAYKALMQRTGITPDKLIEEQDLLIKFAGTLPKEQRTALESDFLNRM